MKVFYIRRNHTSICFIFLCVVVLPWRVDAQTTTTKTQAAIKPKETSQNSLKKIQLEWIIAKDKQLEAKTLIAPSHLIARVGETGYFSKERKTPVEKEAKNGLIEIIPGDTKLIYLAIQNKSKQTYRFAVAPHESNPVEATLNLLFTCLCNGHVYEIKPNKIWYRIMSLKTQSGLAQINDTIVLKHNFIFID